MEFKSRKSKQNTDKKDVKTNLEKLDFIDKLSNKFDEKLNPNQYNAKDEKEEKKNYTISLSKKIIADLETFLEDFGEFGETKSSFIQNAILESIHKQKLEMKKKLLDKIKKLED